MLTTFYLSSSRIVTYYAYVQMFSITRTFFVHIWTFDTFLLMEIIHKKIYLAQSVFHNNSLTQLVILLECLPFRIEFVLIFLFFIFRIEMNVLEKF